MRFSVISAMHYSAASLATQPPLAPDPTMSTSYGMVCTNRLRQPNAYEPLCAAIIAKRAGAPK
jgi:hypothetical protein